MATIACHFCKCTRSRRSECYSPFSSLSEYGCITNDRTFEEVESLYGSQMTPVYSGGLVYEYSEEGSGYGLVKISADDSITTTPDFSALQKQFAKAKPSGDGGYKSDGSASTCPKMSTTWEVKDFTGEELPAMPDGAKKYMDKGAGKGPGLSGPGSQNAGGTSTGTAGPGSASSTSSGSPEASESEGAGVSVVRPGSSDGPLFACAAAVFVSTLFGAYIL